MSEKLAKELYAALLAVAPRHECWCEPTRDVSKHGHDPECVTAMRVVLKARGESACGQTTGDTGAEGGGGAR